MRDDDAPWVDAGSVADVPDRGCAAVADSRVLLIRHGDDILAFENRCLHKDTPLHEGHLTDGILACPLHHWRYELPSGRLVGHSVGLPHVPIEIDGGRIRVVPPEEPPASVSALLRDHARTWSRSDQAPDHIPSELDGSPTPSSAEGTSR